MKLSPTFAHYADVIYTPVLAERLFCGKQHCRCWQRVLFAENSIARFLQTASFQKIYIAGFLRNGDFWKNYIAFHETFQHKNGLHPKTTLFGSNAEIRERPALCKKARISSLSLLRADKSSNAEFLEINHLRKATMQFGTEGGYCERRRCSHMNFAFYIELKGWKR